MCMYKDKYFHVHLRFCIMLKHPRDVSLEMTVMFLAFFCSQAVEENGY
jgi:hypothetical protein